MQENMPASRKPKGSGAGFEDWEEEGRKWSA